MQEELQALTLEDSFQFSCHSQIACFTQCCRDLNQFLTPYDILRLKNNLNLSSTEFLERYTTQHIGPETGLPIISFKTIGNQHLCPFSEKSGCKVYADRPSSCRTYPLVRIAAKAKANGQLSEHYMILQEPHCQGFQENISQTVGEWIDNQGIAIYNQMNDLLMEIIGLKSRSLPGPLSISQRRLFHMACYDLDDFKVHVYEKGLLDNFDIDGNTLESARSDETALLKIGLKWIKQAFFYPE